MPLLERYVLRRILAATAVGFGVLLAMFWTIECLSRVDIVTASGQSIWTFQVITVLALAPIAQIAAPISFLIGLVVTLTRLNSDSELTAIMASGAQRRTVLRPVLVSAALMAAAVAMLSYFLTPSGLSGMRDLLSRVRADIINEAVRVGGFRSLDRDKLIIHIREKVSDGSFRGIFISDVRDPDESLQYIAGRAALIEEAERAFLVLADGTVIRSRPAENATDIVDFKTHAIDLSQFVNVSRKRSPNMSERSTAELIDPDPADPQYRSRPERFSVELHRRNSYPLYPFAFAAIALAGLARPRTGRQDRITAAATVVVLCGGLVVLGISVIGAADAGQAGIAPIYLVPGTAIVAGFAAVLAGLRLSTPDRVAAAVSVLLSPVARVHRALASGAAVRGAGTR